MAYQSTNPYDSSVLASFDGHDGAELEARLHAAADCVERDWRQRFIVVESMADRLLAKLAQARDTFIAGDPLQARTTLAPLSSERALATLLEQVFRVADEDAAVALANDSPFGLGGSAFTQDIERGKQVALRIDTGMVFINSGAVSLPELPFGGVKRSGYGRELSRMGIQEFVNKKLVRCRTAAAPL